MTIDFRTHLKSVQIHPEMHGIPRGLTAAIVYMLAWDASTDGDLLRGFPNWLNHRRGGDGRTSLAWFGEIVTLELGEDAAGRAPYWDLEESDADRVYSILFDNVDQFLADK